LLLRFKTVIRILKNVEIYLFLIIETPLFLDFISLEKQNLNPIKNKFGNFLRKNCEKKKKKKNKIKFFL